MVGKLLELGVSATNIAELGCSKLRKVGLKLNVSGLQLKD